MTATKNILVVDDEPKILEAVTSYLESKGYTVYTAATGNEALEVFEKKNLSLILLDLMLPDISGEEVCSVIRKKSRVPIIMLTAKTGEGSHLNGMELGADDYMTKPFSLKLLAVHVEAILRRSTDDLVPLSVKNSFRNDDLVVDFEKNIILKKGKEVALTPSEYKILVALVKYPGKVFSRESLIGIAFADHYDAYDRTVDFHIRNLRQKMEDSPKAPVYVLTVHGLGYKFGGE